MSDIKLTGYRPPNKKTKNGTPTFKNLFSPCLLLVAMMIERTG